MNKTKKTLNKMKGECVDKLNRKRERESDYCPGEQGRRLKSLSENKNCANDAEVKKTLDKEWKNKQDVVLQI